MNTELPTPLKLRVGAYTDAGTVRKNNEDNYLCDLKRRLFVVCDGMGGHLGGERASALAIEVVDRTLTQEAIDATLSQGEEAVKAMLLETLMEAHRAILKEAEENIDLRKMGSTATIALIGYHNLYLVHVGDSRLYLVRDGVAQVLSRDHSLAATLLEWGNIQPEELRKHPLRGKLVHYLGSPDVLEPHLIAEPICPEDRLLLCSDGIWEVLEDEAIANLIQETGTATELAKSIVQCAIEAKTSDNVTSIVILV
jgi:protein phosphatase